MRVELAAPIITNRQAEARLVLNKVEDFAAAMSKTGLLVMRIVKFCMTRACGNSSASMVVFLQRRQCLSLGHALDALDQIMGKYARQVLGMTILGGVAK